MLCDLTPLFFQTAPVFHYKRPYKNSTEIYIQNRLLTTLKYMLENICCKFEVIPIRGYPGKRTERLRFCELRKRLPNFENVHRCNVAFLSECDNFTNNRAFRNLIADSGTVQGAEQG